VFKVQIGDLKTALQEKDASLVKLGERVQVLEQQVNVIQKQKALGVETTSDNNMLVLMKKKL
jgi:hypothetical protein